jgi:predicted Zn-dependent protease
MDDHTSQGSETARVDALDAFVASIEDGLEYGIEKLGNLEEPARLRSALALLNQNQRFSDAADMVRNRELACTWLDSGVYALVANREIEMAERFLSQADKKCDAVDCQRARIAFAESAFEELLEIDVREGLSVRNNLSEDDRSTIAKIIEILHPLIAKIRVVQRIEHETEHLAVTHSARAFGLLGRLDEIADLVAPLEFHMPVPLLLAQLSLRRICEPPENLVGRLRIEHPTSFSAHFLAALVERDIINRPEEALDALLQLVPRANNEERDAKDALCQVLFETASAIDAQAIANARTAVDQLIGKESRFGLYFEAASLLRDGKSKDALKLLQDNQREDDPVWWQLNAKTYESDEATDLASQAWEKACKLLPHPDLLFHFAVLSIEQRRFQQAADALEIARKESPEDVQILLRLAVAYSNLRAFQQAVGVFNDLVRLEPNESSHRLNHAICLIRSNRAADALQTLQPLCNPENPLIEGIALQCQILAAEGQAAEALDVLTAVKDRFWDTPEFVALFMRTAYGAGDDGVANEAFQQLLKIQNRDEIGDAILQPKSLDDLIEFGDQRRRQREMVMDQVRHGKMPWLFAESFFGVPAFRAWQSRTQDLTWISDEPIPRAEFSVYATNGFSVFEDENGRKHLDPVKAPPADIEIVADLSALITMFQLERLDVVTNRYSKIIVPSSYGDLRSHDGERLAAHQPSRERELRRIRAAIDKRRIAVIDGDSSNESVDELILDEHAPDEAAVFRLQDLHYALSAAQKLNSSDLGELERVCGKQTLAAKSLELPSQITVGMSTVRSLSELSCFDRIVNSVRAALTRQDYDDLVSELKSHEASREAHRLHRDFWDQISDSSDRVDFQSLKSEADLFEEDEPQADRPPYWDAALLAVEIGKPLFADDRVSQAYVLGRPQAKRHAAFGADALLVALAKEEVLPWIDVAKDYLTLMRWRYRFLVPDPMILKVLTDASLPNLPGPELREIAVYAHESLRDPGLFCGPEKLEPAMPISYRLFMAWKETAVQSIRMTWDDPQYSDEQATAFTRWSIQNLIPSTPKGLIHHPLGSRLAKMTPHIVLMSAMIQFTTIQPIQRANVALTVIGEELGMTNREFFTAAAEAAGALNE